MRACACVCVCVCVPARARAFVDCVNVCVRFGGLSRNSSLLSADDTHTNTRARGHVSQVGGTRARGHVSQVGGYSQRRKTEEREGPWVASRCQFYFWRRRRHVCRKPIPGATAISRPLWVTNRACPRFSTTGAGFLLVQPDPHVHMWQNTRHAHSRRRIGEIAHRTR